MKPDRVTLLVGLEIHVQLGTRTKMFTACPAGFGAEPNSLVDPVTLGLPGTLPVLNKRAIDFTLRLGLAFGCQIAEYSKWDRKSYYYPDLPKNYQISQYDIPLCGPGKIDFRSSNGTVKTVRIRRAHLEEDAGKNLHDFPGFTAVDLNRAGTALLEIVTEPDLHTWQDAGALARELQRSVRALGISEAVMQKGHMRFEPNINLVIEAGGKTYKTPIVEVKNLNSFKALENSVAFEEQRQLAQWQADPEGFSLAKLGKQNRGWDDVRGETVFQREKEEAHDYRYFPDPDLPPVRITSDWLDGLRAELPELPLARQIRYETTLGLSSVDAETIVDDITTADLFDAALKALEPGSVTPGSGLAESGANARKILAKQFVNVWTKLANEKSLTVGMLAAGTPGVTSAALAELAGLVASGKVSATAAAQIAGEVVNSGKSPVTLAKELGLEQVQDTGQMEAWVKQALEANPKAVGDAKENAKKRQAALGFLRGQVMKLSAGKADPKLIGTLLEKMLGG